MKNQVTNGFDRMPVSQLLVKANFITTEMTNNSASFPAANPPIGMVKTATTELQAANLAAQNRDRVAIAYRDEKKNELVALLHRLGVYVNMCADGNRAIALSSGFDVKNDSQPKPPITFVDAPIVTAGPNTGELETKVKAVAGARMYQYFISADETLPVAEWTNYSSTRLKFSFSGLVSATRYFVRVAAIGINQQMVLSDSASYVTQ